VTNDGLGLATADLLLTLLFGAVFLALFALHRWDLGRRRRRAAGFRAAGDFGPDSAAVLAVVAAAAGLDGAMAERLAVERRRAFEWDPRLDKVPKVARLARDRAFANLRDDVARAAADAARDAATAALADAPADARVVRDGAEGGAETAAASAAAARMPAAEFRMLTRAWRAVVGPIGVAPRREP
jgi:hypothetical protein